MACVGRFGGVAGGCGGYLPARGLYVYLGVCVLRERVRSGAPRPGIAARRRSARSAAERQAPDDAEERGPAAMRKRSRGHASEHVARERSVCVLFRSHQTAVATT